MQTFHYTMKGDDANGQQWEHSGDIEVEPAFVHTVLSLAMIESFRALTEGKAVFGQPGKGCRGPYRITEFQCRLT